MGIGIPKIISDKPTITTINNYYNSPPPQQILNIQNNFNNGRPLPTYSNSTLPQNKPSPTSNVPQKNNSQTFQNYQNQNNIRKGPQMKYDENNKIKPKQLNNQNDLMVNQMQDQQVQRLQKIIQQYQKNIQKAKQYGRKMNDYTKYDEFRKLSLETYLTKLKQMNLQQNIISNDKICRKAIIGKISSGKSSLLNTLFGLDLQIGTGQTTLQPTIVYNKNNVVLIDTPGQNEDFNTQQIENIKLLSQANQIYILYPDSLKNAEHLVRVITAIKPKNTILIRTKCDLYTKKDKRTIEEEIKNDYKVIDMWGIKGIQIYTTSAEVQNGFQNAEIKKKLQEFPKIGKQQKY